MAELHNVESYYSLLNYINAIKRCSVLEAHTDETLNHVIKKSPASWITGISERQYMPAVVN